MRALTMKTQSLQNALQSNKTNKQQQGFTLIELVIVIVILGILAATAAPKFIDLQGDAKEATLKGVRGSLETAMAGVYAKAIIAGKEKLAAQTVQVNGSGVTTEYGYPEAVVATLNSLLDADDFDKSLVTGTPDKIMFYPKGTTPTTPAAGNACSVEYTEATSSAKATSKVNTGCF